jgi:hypothetical protein
LPRKNGHLTASERTFAEVFAATGDQAYAGRKAGYVGSAGPSLAAKRPEVQAEVERQRAARLDAMVDKAIKTIDDCMDSKTSTWTNKLVAAEIVLDRRDKAKEAGFSKEPSEMTWDELTATIKALQVRQASIAEQAIDVTPEPVVSTLFD